MTAGDIAQIASALFTALAALAAFLTIRQSNQEAQIAREALEAETRPILADLPIGEFFEEKDWHEIDGSTRRKQFDRAELEVGVYASSRAADGPVCIATVPIRNIGKGPARISEVRFSLEDGTSCPGFFTKPVLPQGEIMRVGIQAEQEDPNVGVAEEIAMALSDFSVVVAYSDASGRLDEALVLDIGNGQHPRVAKRRWHASLDEVMAVVEEELRSTESALDG